MTGKTDTTAKDHLRRWKGLDRDRKPIFLDYATVERMIYALLDRVKEWEPAAVVGIARGGIVPATMMASTLCLPLELIGFDRKLAQANWIGTPSSAKRIVLVDDGCSSGATMRASRDMLIAEGRDVLSFAVVHDPEVSKFIPDVSHPMRELWRFPWERGETTPASRASRTAGEWQKAEDELPFIGLDLDGIFLPDLPQSVYDSDLAAALIQRDGLEPFETLPSFEAHRAVLITGRPDSDRERTMKWLERWGHSALPLETRPSRVPYKPLDVARYKADVATKRGCTHFIESDPQQAILIAAIAPHLVVTWWDGVTRTGHIVGAAVTRSSKEARIRGSIISEYP